MSATAAQSTGLGEMRSSHDSEDNPIGLTPGTLIGGRYLSGRMLGRGAMGVVFEGTHHELDERVAIKFLLPDHLENQEIVGRFSREAKAAVKLKGEHVARVLDVGKHEGRIPYIVMEYLDGEDLGQRVERLGPLPIEEACGYVIEACAGLAEAHARGVVHRDVKPENLFLTQLSDGRSRVKILDFGVSKVALTGSSLADHNLAATSTMLGSPLYMSPEQIRSRDVDHRSDIWSLGVTFYELLTGQTPFHAGTITELVGRVLEEPPPPLRGVRSDVPEALERIILRCLVRDPAQRWESVASMAIALLPFAPRSSRDVAEHARALVMRADDSASLSRLPMPPSVPASMPPPAFSGSTSASVTLVAPEPRTSRTLMLAIPLALLALGIGGFVLREPKASTGSPELRVSGAAPASAAPTAAEHPPVQPSDDVRPRGSATPSGSDAPPSPAQPDRSADAGTHERPPPTTRTGPARTTPPAVKSVVPVPKDDIRLTR